MTGAAVLELVWSQSFYHRCSIRQLVSVNGQRNKAAIVRSTINYSINMLSIAVAVVAAVIAAVAIINITRCCL